LKISDNFVIIARKLVINQSTYTNVMDVEGTEDECVKGVLAAACVYCYPHVYLPYLFRRKVKK
jgi:hypothetical protein